MKDWIARTLYPYGSIRTVHRGPLRGYWYVVRPGMGISFAWNLGASREAFLTEQIEPGATVYDVGANRGQLALLFSHLVGETGTVLSFEPVEKLADAIRRNAELNGIENV